MDSAPMLRIEGLTKRYRGRHGVLANDGIDLAVQAGQVVGLLGHNGAGKTTLVNQVVGLVRPDRGTIVLDGIDAVAHPDQARRRTSIQAQANVPITGLTPRAAIALVGRIRGGQAATIARRTDELVEALDLTPWASTVAEKVSGGVARLTAFAMAVVQPTPLLVLDEPTNDVDPVRRRLLWEQIRRAADQGSAVLVVTHNVREAERVVDRLVVLDHGRVLATGSPAELTASRRGRLIVEIDLGRAAPEPHRAMLRLERHPHRWTAEVDQADAADLVTWAQTLVQDGAIERYSLTPASLEDSYIELTGATQAADDQPEVAA